jgi:membrane protease YdiL (CAAX protease family)
MKKASRNEIAAVILSLCGLVLMYLLSREVGNLWHRLSLFYVFMLPAAFLAVRLEWKKLFRFQGKHLLYGLVSAAVLYFVGLLGVVVLREIRPRFAAEVEGMYIMLANVPGWQLWPLFAWVIFAEEVVWRQAATQPFVQRLKDGAAIVGALAFLLVHLPWAPPALCIAAFVFGGAWSWMAVRTKSFWPAFISHVAWDILVMFVARY